MTKLSTRDKLLASIDSFLARSKMSRTRFGVWVQNDTSLYFRIAQGGDVHSATVDRINTMIAAWRPGQEISVPKKSRPRKRRA